MPLRMWGQYVIQSDQPGEDPVVVGTQWFDPDTNTLYVCTSVSPYTFAAQIISTHNLLSLTHPDTTPATVQRGDLVVGQGASPLWKRLAIGAADTVLTSDGVDVSWQPSSGNSRAFVLTVGSFRA